MKRIALSPILRGRGLLLLALWLLLRGEVPVRGDNSTAAFPALVQAIDALLDTPELKVGFQGILIRSLKDGTILYERHADQLFLPASNNKLLTSGIALQVLGPDFVYRTRLLRMGPILSGGVLDGDLVFVGAGDPLLPITALDTLAQQTKQAGIRRVRGRLRYDESFFDSQRLGNSWSWDDESFYYSAQVSALTLNEGLVNVQVTPGSQVGSPVQVVVGPTQRYATLVNTAVTGPAKSRNTLEIERVRGRNLITLKGSLPIDAPPAERQPVGVTVEDPARYATTVLGERLRRAGIWLYEGVQEGPPAPATAALVAEYTSPPLAELLKRFNKPSDNLVGECLLKTVGAKRNGKGGSWEGGAAVAREWFGQIGLDTTRLRQADGSGLSRVNYVSPRNLVTLLTWFHGSPQFRVLYDSLPIAGVDGTLRNRMKGTPAEGNCRAKTGTLSHSSCLSGYVTTTEGEMLAFSLMMNHHLSPARTCTTVQDKIVALLATFKRP